MKNIEVLWTTHTFSGQPKNYNIYKILKYQSRLLFSLEGQLWDKRIISNKHRKAAKNLLFLRYLSDRRKKRPAESRIAK